MQKLLNIYYTVNHASITVEDLASRKTSGGSMVEVINAMCAEDKAVLVGFCKAVVNYTQEDKQANSIAKGFKL